MPAKYYEHYTRPEKRVTYQSSTESGISWGTIAPSMSRAVRTAGAHCYDINKLKFLYGMYGPPSATKLAYQTNAQYFPSPPSPGGELYALPPALPDQRSSKYRTWDWRFRTAPVTPRLRSTHRRGRVRQPLALQYRHSCFVGLAISEILFGKCLHFHATSDRRPVPRFAARPRHTTGIES